MTKTETLLVTRDWDKKALVDCPEGTYTEICTHEVESGHILKFGYGDKNDGVDDRGIFKVILKGEKGEVIKGKIRIKARDKGDDISSKGMAPRTERLTGDGVRLGVAEAGVGATRERLLVLEFMPDVDCKVKWSASTVEVPITDLYSPNFR